MTTPPTPAIAEVEQDATASPAPKSFRVTFARGMIYGGIALVFGKLAAFVSQYYLGRIFDERTFGLFAMAITAATIGDVFNGGAIKVVVVSRANEYAAIARTAGAVALATSIGAAVLVAATAPLWAYGYYGQPSVMWLLFILAGAMLLTPFGVVQRGKLEGDMRFGAVSLIDSAASGLRHGSLMLFAYLGFREYSFVWPVVLINLMYAVVGRGLVGRLPPSRVDRPLAVEIFNQIKWVILVGIGATIIARGAFFVGGGFAKDDVRWVAVLGVFFFGYQLCHSLFGLFNISMNSIMQPAFAAMKENPRRQAETYYTVVRSTIFLAAPMTTLGALVAPLFIHVLWSGKWDDTIAVVQLLALTEAVRQLHFISVALLSAKERYRAAAALTMLDAGATLLAALIGCWMGGLLSLTIAVAVQRVVCSLAEAMYVYASIGGRPSNICLNAMKPLIASTLLGITGYALVTALVIDPARQFAALALAGVPFVVLYALTARVLTRPQYDEAADLLRRSLGRRFARRA